MPRSRSKKSKRSKRKTKKTKVLLKKTKSNKKNIRTHRGGAMVEKRIEKEKSLLDPHYIIKIYNDTTWILINKNTKDYYVMTLSNDYPLGGTNNLLIKGKLIPNCSITNTIIQCIDLIPSFGQLKSFDPTVALVYCHPYSIHPTNRKFNHWASMVFTEIINENNKDPNDCVFLSLDVKRQENDITADGFSEDFISRNKNSFDWVILPDCAGEWVRASEEASIRQNYEILFKILKSILRLVKPDGCVYVSKFFSDNFSSSDVSIERIVDAMKGVFDATFKDYNFSLNSKTRYIKINQKKMII